MLATQQPIPPISPLLASASPASASASAASLNGSASNSSTTIHAPRPQRAVRARRRPSLSPSPALSLDYSTAQSAYSPGEASGSEFGSPSSTHSALADPSPSPSPSPSPPPSSSLNRHFETQSQRPSASVSQSRSAPQPLHQSPSRIRPSAIASSSKSKPAPASAPTSRPGTPGRPPSRTERKFPCTWEGCDKAYFKPSRLAEHYITHTGERPHACPHCSQTYLRATHLHAHLRTHLTEDAKQFLCDRPGCGKKFWTATHRRRHVEVVHDASKPYQCTHCEECFAKAHLLRDHVTLTHMPKGTKPYPCTHDGCNSSFAMKAHLKAHEKTHDPHRYTCSDPSHTSTLPTFPTWTALQSHIHEAHPPSCPYPECNNRTFKSSQRLKEHLKVHEEREADLLAAAERAANDDGDVHAEAAEGGVELQAGVRAEEGDRRGVRRSGGRKRALDGTSDLGAREKSKRRKVSAAQVASTTTSTSNATLPTDDDDASARLSTGEPSDSSEHMSTLPTRPITPATTSEGGNAAPELAMATSGASPGSRLPKIKGGEAGKVFACGHPDCGKKFKTRHSITTHTKASHLKLRPYICTHPGCEKAYAHQASLNKHVANHASAATDERDNGVNEQASRDTDTGVDKGRLTGDGSALKRFGCPIHAAEGLLARPKDTPDQPGVTSSSDTIIVDCSGAAPSTEPMPGQIDEYDPSGRPTAETLQAWDESLLTCPMRFWRVYDVRRHLAAEHGLVLEDAEVRKLLGMAV